MPTITLTPLLLAVALVDAAPKQPNFVFLVRVQRFCILPRFFSRPSQGMSVEADVERSRKAGRAYGEDGDDDFDDHRRRGGKRRSRFLDIFD